MQNVRVPTAASPPTLNFLAIRQTFAGALIAAASSCGLRCRSVSLTAPPAANAAFCSIRSYSYTMNAGASD